MKVVCHLFAAASLAYVTLQFQWALIRLGAPGLSHPGDTPRRFKILKHLDGPLWEMHMKGKDGISRAVYVTARGSRVVVVRVFVKKTQKTPRREIEIALQRAQEVQDQ